jgi:UPF0148 protein
MSDTDDGFDEEAVRRELREKYEDEREDRETTARMSELLLQGATMTNQHCDRCGSPLFRYDGREFCPTCQHEAQQQADAQQQVDGQQQTETSTQQTSDDGAADASEPARADEAGDPAEAQTHASRDRRTPPSQAERDRSTGDTSAGQQRTGGRSTSDAEGALESSINALARRAAGADDPRTATEYMEAAREAAEALAALRHNA